MPIDNDTLCTFSGAPNLCGLMGMENCSKSETPKFGLMFGNRLKEDGENGLAPRGPTATLPYLHKVVSRVYTPSTTYPFILSKL